MKMASKPQNGEMNWKIYIGTHCKATHGIYGWPKVGVHKRTTSSPKVAGTNAKNDAIYSVLQAHFSK